METTDLIRENGIITVVNAPVQERLFEWAIAVAKGGVKLLGIPVTFPVVTEVVSDLADEASLCVGLSGVTSADQVAIALAAGAQFILSPIGDRDIIKTAKDRGLTVIAGGATPTEVARCARAGIDMVNVFPASALGGPTYVRQLLALLPDTPLVASGGVDIEAAPAYLEAGATAAVVDTGVFPQEEDASAVEVITMRALALTEVCGEVLGRSDRVSMTEILTGG